MPVICVLNEQNSSNIDMIYWLRADIIMPFIFQTVLYAKENNCIVYFMMTHYTNCDEKMGKKFKLKCLVNKALKRKSIKNCITVSKVLAHNAIKIFVS